MLGVIPPAEVFDLKTCLLESLFGSLDLGLEAAVRKQEGQLVVDENFHFSCPLETWSVSQCLFGVIKFAEAGEAVPALFRRTYPSLRSVRPRIFRET
jgi:hypothetical protein